MAFAREYFPSDCLKLLNQSEGRAGSSGAAAHAMARHLRHSPPPTSSVGQPLHQGVSADLFARRFQDDPLDDNGNYRVNSGWLGKGDMALFLAKLLNSQAGAAGLSGLDTYAQRVSVQTYFVDTKDVRGTKMAGAVAEIRTSATAPTISYHPINDRNPLSGQMRGIKINKPTHKGVIRVKDIVGAVAVLDNVGGELHIQTFYPLFKVEGRPMAQYNIGTMKKTVTIAPDGGEHVTLQLG